MFPFTNECEDSVDLPVAAEPGLQNQAGDGLLFRFAPGMLHAVAPCAALYLQALRGMSSCDAYEFYSYEYELSGGSTLSRSIVALRPAKRTRCSFGKEFSVLLAAVLFHMLPVADVHKYCMIVDAVNSTCSSHSPSSPRAHGRHTVLCKEVVR